MRYPAGSLTSELLTIHQEHYVIRALVQVGGMTLATGMASATNIEQAEDRAKVRALTTLGMNGFASPSPATNLSYPLSSSSDFSSSSNFKDSSEFDFPNTPTNPSPEHPPTSVQGSIKTSGTIASGTVSSVTADFKTDSKTDRSSWSELGTPEPSATSLTDQPSMFTSALQSPPHPLEDANLLEGDNYSNDFAQDATLSAPSDVEPSSDSLFEHESYLDHDSYLANEPYFEDEPPQPTSLATPTPEPTKTTSTSKKSPKRKAESTKTPPAAPAEDTSGLEVVDRSDVNAKIGVEMKRLGWTVDQGRNYLKRTYGKQSRQQLDDSELLDFLRYLELQPQPSSALF